jgi:hypothetical protein
LEKFTQENSVKNSHEFIKLQLEIAEYEAKKKTTSAFSDGRLEFLESRIEKIRNTFFMSFRA